jgi:uncharacterized repeat protein (TIGR01451 family)
MFLGSNGPDTNKPGLTLMAYLQSLFRAAGAAVLAAGLAGAAHAAGTDAGTTVSNTFTLDYDVGGVAQPTIDNTAAPTEFTVDRLIDLTITTLDPTQDVAPNSSDNVIRYRLTNLGNDVQAYDLSVSTAGSTYTPSNVDITYFIDLNNDGVLNGAEVLETYTPGNPTVDIAPDQNVVVRVESDVPTSTPDGETATLTLTADTLYPTNGASLDGNCTPALCPEGTPVAADSDGNDLVNAAENVLADAAGSTDAANQGDFSAAGTLNVVAPTLAASKTVVMLDTDPASEAACNALTAPAAGDQYSTPGSCVQYIISITNSGSGTASNLSVADRLPAEVRFLKAELATTTGTGFADDTGIAGAGPSLAAPGAPEDCDGSTNCLVDLSDAILAAGENGQIRIWTLVR